MSRYHAHLNGYLTIGDDPTPVVEVCAPHAITQLTALSELASDGNHCKEWAARAAAIVWSSTEGPVFNLLCEMAKYHRDGQEKQE